MMPTAHPNGFFSADRTAPGRVLFGAPRRFAHSVALLGALLASALGPACSRSVPVEVPGDAPLRAVLVLSTNEIHVGDVVEARLAVVHPSASILEVDELGRGEEVSVLNRSELSSPISAEAVRSDWVWRFTSFEVGRHVVSTGTLSAVASEGQRWSIPFPEAHFTVSTLLPETADQDVEPRGLKGPVRWPPAVSRFVVALVVVSALAVVAGLLAAWMLGRNRRRASLPPPLVDPHRQALEALQALHAEDLVARGLIEPYYVRLSAIVRLFIERRFGLKAPELTTEEFIREASSSGRLSPDHQRLVNGFLTQSDMVKFARHSPSSDDMRAAFAAAERLVRETEHPPAEAAP